MDVAVQKLRYKAKKSPRRRGLEDFIVTDTSSCRDPFVAVALIRIN